MKKFLVIFWLLGFFINSAFALQLESYQGSKNGIDYSLRYPLGCQVLDKKINGDIEFVFSSLNKDNNLSEGVLITVGDISQKPFTLEELEALWMQELSKVSPQVRHLDKRETIIDGKKAMVYTYTNINNAVNFKYLMYVLISNGNLIELLYGAKEENFDKYLPSAELVIMSLKISAIQAKTEPVPLETKK